MTDPTKLREALARIENFRRVADVRPAHLDEFVLDDDLEVVVDAAKSTLPKTRKVTVYRMRCYAHGGAAYSAWAEEHVADVLERVRSALDDGCKVVIAEPQVEEWPI